MPRNIRITALNLEEEEALQNNDISPLDSRPHHYAPTTIILQNNPPHMAEVTLTNSLSTQQNSITTSHPVHALTQYHHYLNQNAPSETTHTSLQNSHAHSEQNTIHTEYDSSQDDSSRGEVLSQGYTNLR